MSLIMWAVLIAPSTRNEVRAGWAARGREAAVDDMVEQGRWRCRPVMLGITSLPVSRRSGFDPREKDTTPMTAPPDSVYRPVVPDERDVDPLPVVTKATDYPAGHVIELHHHARGQLV